MNAASRERVWSFFSVSVSSWVFIFLDFVFCISHWCAKFGKSCFASEKAPIWKIEKHVSNHFLMAFTDIQVTLKFIFFNIVEKACYVSIKIKGVAYHFPHSHHKLTLALLRKYVIFRFQVTCVISQQAEKVWIFTTILEWFFY